MRKSINLFVVFISLVFFAQCLVYADNAETATQETPKRELLGLKITGFVENSNLKNAGAQEGDILTHYNGIKIESLEQLRMIKDKVEQDTVEIVLKRGDEEIKTNLPKGMLGAYLQEIMPEHPVDIDAKLISGIGQLGWGIGMENSFLGCITLLEEKYGSKLSYSDILGLSGYGFRFHFFKGFCPSSPDATCGRDVGGEVLKKLGYEFEVYSLSDTCKKCNDEKCKEKEQLLDIIKKGIDQGFPVIAIDLIETAEWGIITGYQKNGKELFCRTYFDMTQGYEIAQKFPWVIYVIKGNKPANLDNEYRKSLITAKELYNKKNYGAYENGLNGIKIWIKTLKDDKFFKSLDEKKLYETMHANWWIYYSLADARLTNSKYLITNKGKFGLDEKIIYNLTQLMEKESALLQSGFDCVPSIFDHKDASAWTSELRKNQAKVLSGFLKLEEQVNQILKSKI